MTDNAPVNENAGSAIPAGFGMENEHPMLSMPFSVRIGDETFEGKRISVTRLEVDPSGTSRPATGTRGLATIQFPFEDFAITLMAQVSVTAGGDNDPLELLFSEPTGAHLAQLRYIMNSFIAGDLISLKGMMAYTGPTQPKAPKGADAKPAKRERVRSIAVAIISLVVAFFAATAVFSRYTTAYEMHPVFIDRAGLTMQATVAGQVTFLDPEAATGEVAYTIAATSGDVLSFQMPREGQIAVSSDIFEGATVLPDDLILTIFDNSNALRLRTMISIEGLQRALKGDPVRIDLNDGRKLPAKILVRDTTRAASLRGDLFVPVDLAVIGGGLGPSDINKSARVRLSKTLSSMLGYRQEN